MTVHGCVYSVFLREILYTIDNVLLMRRQIIYACAILDKIYAWMNFTQLLFLSYLGQLRKGKPFHMVICIGKLCVCECVVLCMYLCV